MRVAFIAEAGESPSAYYRAVIPAKGLQAAGHETFVGNVMMECDDGTLNTYPPLKRTPEVMVCRRMLDPTGEPISSAHMFVQARKRGQRVYVDVDDDPWNVPEWNPAYGTMSPSVLRAWEHDMQAATGVICSTAAIAESVNHHATSHTFVCENGVDLAEYPSRFVHASPEHEPLRLAWLSLTSFRGEDLRMIVPWLREALQGLAGEVEFWHLGQRDETPPVADILGTGFPVRVVERPWVDIEMLPTVLREVDCAVIPQRECRFAYGRSCITGVALMAAGVPFVASTMPEYLHLWVRGGGYVVSNDPHSWSTAVRQLVTQETFRRDVRNSGLSLARTYDVAPTAAQWSTVFEQAHAGTR